MAENLNHIQLSEVSELDEMAKAGGAVPKKAFVEPEVSFPIDVLESTTFFQFTESGATN
jgi:hypothetical protein